MCWLLVEVGGSSNDVCVKIKSSRRPTATSCRRRRRRRRRDEMRPLAQSQEHTLAVRMFWSSIYLPRFFRAFIVDFIDNTFDKFLRNWRQIYLLRCSRFTCWETTNFCCSLHSIPSIAPTSLEHEVIKKMSCFSYSNF